MVTVADDSDDEYLVVLYVVYAVGNMAPQKLERLEQMDIIEKAEGSTTWISPIVVVPQKEGV